MELIKVVLSSVLSIAAIFILTKLIGNKQLSEAHIFDYINGITVGSIAAEMATSLENDVFKPLVAMVVYTVFVITISYLDRKSLRLRRIFSGKSLVLYDSGKLYYDNFKKTGIDINEFLVSCRLNGYFDLNEIHTAIFETNGKISFLPNELNRSLQPKDTNLIVSQSRIMTNLIVDGKIIEGNLQKCKKTKEWLFNNLKKQNAGNIDDIFLASYDGENKFNIYKKTNEKNNRSPFE